VALDAIRDQPRAVALLRRALATDRVAHAYAFVGPTGAGRMTTALAFAQALLCPDAGCGACQACRLAALRQHPAGLTRSQISQTLGHHQPAGEIDHALHALDAAGRATATQIPTGGRPAQLWSTPA